MKTKDNRSSEPASEQDVSAHSVQCWNHFGVRFTCTSLSRFACNEISLSKFKGHPF